MGWRIEDSLRCPHCYLRQPLCYCATLEKLSLTTRVVVLMHKRERVRSSNTGRLAQLTLTNSEIRIRGDHVPMSTEGIIETGRTSLLLYPFEDASDLTKEFVQTLKGPFTLIVPDGNWRQASKVGIREKALSEAIRVKLPIGKASEYQLRREHRADGMATFEAIARALGVLESAEVQNRLEEIFTAHINILLKTRGRRSHGTRFISP